MKTIKKNELYRHLSGFLQGKGIALTDGTYTARVRQGCTLLTDVINGTQRGLSEARTQMDQSLDKMRQIIHEKTAPKPAAPAAPPPPPPAADRRKKGARRKPKPTATGGCQ